MKYLLIALLFIVPSLAFSQIDSIAHARNWIKLVPVQADIFNRDTIIYCDWDRVSTLDEVNHKLSFWVRFYNKFGSIVAQKYLVGDAENIFLADWYSFPIGKKIYILQQWGFTEVAY